MENNNPKENTTAGHKRRVTVKLTHPNPLFEKWLTEWKLEAEAKDSNLKYSLQNALKSLQKYPIPLESGKECAILKGFGTRICQMLDQRLHEYRKNRENKINNDNQLTENESVSKPKRVRKSKDLPSNISFSKNSSSEKYMPRAGSGGYAILLALLTKEQETSYPGFLLKNDLITSAQLHCDKSMTVAEPGTRYTAWSSMKTLLEKDLVRTQGRPAKFSLTEDGRNIAMKLHADNTNEDDEIVSNPLKNQFPSCSLSLDKFSSRKPSPESSKKPLETKSIEIICLDDESHSPKNIEQNFDFNSDDDNDFPNIDYNSDKFNDLSPSKETSQPSPKSFEKHFEINSDEIISLDDDSDCPKNTEHNFHFNSYEESLFANKNNDVPQSGNKSENILKPLEDENHVSDEYIPDSTSNEFALLKKMFLKSQDSSYLGFLLKSDYNTFQNISSMEILLRNGVLVEEDSNKISITDKGLNLAISLYTKTNIDRPPSVESKCTPPLPKFETNEEIIEGIISSPLFRNKFRISHLNFDGIEDNDLPISSPPKSPLNWVSPKYPEIPNQIETIDLDEDLMIIAENPIFMKIRNKFSDIEKNFDKFIDDSNDNAILSDKLKIKEKNGYQNGNKDISVEKESLKEVKIKEKKANQKLSNDISKEKESPKETLAKSNFDDIVFYPSQFEIILLVDTQETSGTKKSNLNDVTQQELTRYGIKFEIRRLSVGDFAWIARNTLNQELILPYILERKRMDDLSSSIKDGRFHEQKFRLKHCGIQNLIYLVESYGSKDHLGLPFNTLLQAATNTQVQENFIVKFTECHRHSMAYISTFSKQLIQIFKDKTLTGCSKETLIDSDIVDRIIPLMTFSEFNKASTKNKNVKVRELFMRQLLQIKGVSFEKAMAITELYPSPLRLRIAYMKHPDCISEKLLSSIQYSKMNRFIGPAISKSIYQLYTKQLL